TKCTSKSPSWTPDAASQVRLNSDLPFGTSTDVHDTLSGGSPRLIFTVPVKTGSRRTTPASSTLPPPFSSTRRALSSRTYARTNSTLTAGATIVASFPFTSRLALATRSNFTSGVSSEEPSTSLPSSTPLSSCLFSMPRSLTVGSSSPPTSFVTIPEPCFTTLYAIG